MTMVMGSAAHPWLARVALIAFVAFLYAHTIV